MSDLRPVQLRSPGGVAGAQAIHRAAALLKQVACEASDGVKLQVLCAQLGLQMPTAHRILRGLIAEGMIAKDDASGRYRLGPVIYELGLGAAPNLDLRALCAPSMRRLAANSGDSVFLVVRSDYDGVCIDRHEGAFPVRIHTLDVGRRRPLGMGAAAVALLMGLPAHEAGDILQANALRFRQFGVALDAARRAVDEANAHGFAWNDGMIKGGQRGVAVPCNGRDGTPFAAFSIATVSSRMSRARVPELVAMLRSEAAAVEKQVSRQSR
jgi:DNA-binding IclR family transcriptional regulator